MKDECLSLENLTAAWEEAILGRRMAFAGNRWEEIVRK